MLKVSKPPVFSGGPREFFWGCPGGQGRGPAPLENGGAGGCSGGDRGCPGSARLSNGRPGSHFLQQCAGTHSSNQEAALSYGAIQV